MHAFIRRHLRTMTERWAELRLPQPRLDRLFSLKYLIFIAFSIVLIPVLIALSYAAMAMNETTALSEATIYQIVEQVKTGRLILQKVSEDERKAKLFVLLADPSLRHPYDREAYENVRAALAEALNALLNLRVDSKVTLLAKELLEKERLIYEQIVGSDANHDVRMPIDEAFKGLHVAANALWQEIIGRTDAELNELHEQAASVRIRFLLKGAALVILAVLMGLGLLTVLNRSMRQLDESIRQMGAGNLAIPIRVTGPQDLRQLGEKLDDLRGRLLALESSKQRMMRNVCAEIEAPLASAGDRSAALAEQFADALTPEQEAMSLALSSDIENLRALFDELKRYSRASETLPSPAGAPVNLKTLLESVVAAQQPLLQTKGLTVKALAQPVKVGGSPDALQTVIENLLANAIEYSPEGGEIRIMLRASGATMELEIEDDGPGIDPDERSRVFEPFFRGRAAQAGDSKGSGMGLAIVNECVIALNGRVDVVEPREDRHGARLRVQIPLIETK